MPSKAPGDFGPQLLLREAVARRNLTRMAAKARRVGVDFRPHFKTHQSAPIGEWYRAAGVDRITVSSVPMAQYFAAAGWDDILVAIPVDLRATAAIAELSRKIRFHVLVDHADAIAGLESAVGDDLRVWLEVDVGDGRTGVRWDDALHLRELARKIEFSPNLHFAGLLAHAGHAYAARGAEAIRAVHQSSMEALAEAKNTLTTAEIPVRAVSTGDTPTCSLADSFPGITEIRPGNFIFYDLMQAQIGACTNDDIAVALKVPVIGRYPRRNEFVVHGGAVYLSKDALTAEQTGRFFGRVARLTAAGWGPVMGDTWVRALSQEHAVIRTTPEQLAAIAVGDPLAILPVHSCLTADIMGQYVLTDGPRAGTIMPTWRQPAVLER